MLSENLTQANVREYLQSLGFIGVGGGRFFINGVDTETTGVDVVLTFPFESAAAGRFDFTLVGNWSETDVTRVPQTQQLAALNPPPPLFDRINVLTFEEGNPEYKLGAVVNWNVGNLGATVRATHYGEALEPGTAADLDFTMSAETLIDLEARYAFTDNIRLALGAEDLLDEYPDTFPIVRNPTGNAPYSNYSPFGRSGRFVYGRVTFDFD